MAKFQMSPECMMSIREQVEDAKFLAANGRHLGALTVLMLAIAASSRKMFPKGSPSIVKPGEKMPDGEAFELFLGGRIRRLLFGAAMAPEFGNSGVLLPFRERSLSIEHILYKFYRCELIHEGELPTDVSFGQITDVERTCITLGSKDLLVGVGINAERLIMDHGWIDLLINAIVHARVNGPEFGIEHFDIVPIVADVAAFHESLIKTFDITPGRLAIMLEVALEITPATIDASDDASLRQRFENLVRSDVLNGGALTGLRGRGLIGENNLLQTSGIALLRQLAQSYTIVRVV